MFFIIKRYKEAYNLICLLFNSALIKINFLSRLYHDMYIHTYIHIIVLEQKFMHAILTPVIAQLIFFIIILVLKGHVTKLYQILLIIESNDY